MDKIKYMSGEELVAKGATKQNTTLPEIGLKDVLPNESWLEQKQIQSALETRKQLIEVERIEKSGFLSEAEWREDLQLAEVTRQSGGYWQYLGHHQDKQIYLLPEEALFLIEVNCLRLTYNEVTVSLQQAYSLLLRGKITLLQYKVYASLSRLGYKIYRHSNINLNTASNKAQIGECSTEPKDNSRNNIEENQIESQMNVDCIISNDKVENSNLSEDCDNTIVEENIIVRDGIVDSNASTSNSHTVVTTREISEPSTSKKQCNKQNKKVLTKIIKLSNRNNKTLSSKIREKFFELIPDFTNNTAVTINVPEETYLPRNIFLHNLNYKIDLQQLKNRPRIPQTRRYSSSDLNGPEIRRIRNSSVDSTFNDNYNTNQFNTFPKFFQNRFMYHNRYHPFNYRSIGFPRTPNYHLLLNFLLPRPYQHFTMPQFIRHTSFFRPPRFFSMNQMQQEDVRRKRSHEEDRLIHLGAIKRLSLKLKKFISNGFRREDNVHALNNLISTYNTKYGCRLHLNENFDLIIDNNLVETIDLEDGEGSPRKKQKNSNDRKLYEDNLNLINKLAVKLKVLEEKGESTSKLRRSFSNLVKKINQLFNADVHLDSDYKVYDKNNTVIDLSDTESVPEEVPKIKNKLVRNPFSIKHKKADKKKCLESSNTQDTCKYEELKTIFGDSWLPKEDDFGTAVIAHKKDTQTQILTSQNEHYIYEFMRNCNIDFDNWNTAKITFWENTEFQIPESQNENSLEINDVAIDSIVKPNDCHDMASVLEKLRIIKTCKDIGETKLWVDFDVYYKDVQNFRKSNKPKPHFRIVCVDATQDFPSGSEITALHSRYPDNIPIVFAVIIHDAISYVQMNPTDIPVYIPSSELP